jgi:hypothetical protein
MSMFFEGGAKNLTDHGRSNSFLVYFRDMKMVYGYLNFHVQVALHENMHGKRYSDAHFSSSEHIYALYGLIPPISGISRCSFVRPSRVSSDESIFFGSDAASDATT